MDNIKKALSGLILVLLILLAIVVEIFVIKPVMIVRAFNPSKYIKTLWLSLDQHLNAILFGDRDETLSSRIGKHIHYSAPEPKWFSRLAIPLFWLLHWFDFNHCWKSMDFNVGWGKYKKGKLPVIFPSLSKSNLQAF